MKHFIFSFLILVCFQVNAQFTISGNVYNEQKEPLDFASVFIKDSDYATSTDPKGYFQINDVKPGKYIIKASFIGYKSVEREIEVNADLVLEIIVEGTIYDLDEVQISATSAEKTSPIAYEEMSAEEIQRANIAQDVPYVLKWMPSVTVTSDAGTGIGYTGIRVRGSEASRTNVTINGVPLNDSESQTVFWVDLPDFLTNVQSVQIQRGVGVSTNGTSAFGATVQLNTDQFRQNSFANITLGGGSFNTNKVSAHIGTGLINNFYSVEARYSRIASDGYVDRASSNLNSYFFSASRISEGTSLKLNVFSGGEKTYQAWNGLPYQLLETNRTYNTAGQREGEDPYDNEIDNYRQTHAQLVFKKSFSKKSVLNLTGHATLGNGFYENYKENISNQDYRLTPDTLSQDIVIQRWLDNVFYGIVGSYNYKLPWVDMVLGGGANRYSGIHFGDVIWRETDLGENVQASRWYTNDARKNEANIYSRFTFNIWEKLYPFVDLQVRHVNYRGKGRIANLALIDFEDNLTFFNPKVGISYLPNQANKLFIYYGIANREPSRDEYVNNISLPKPEKLNDFEFGFNHNSKFIEADLTYFNMQYQDQLVPTGKLSDVGDYIRTNVDESFREGLEIGLLAKASKRIQLGYFGTISRNKIVSFTEYIDDYDNYPMQIEVIHTNTDIAYSPNQLHAIVSKFSLLPENNKHSVILQANYKFVGEQYLDNTSNDFSRLDAFSYMDILINYSTKFWKVRDFDINLQINNVLNNEYVSNGWIYRFQTTTDNPVLTDNYARAEGNNVYNQTGLFPQAPLNFLIGMTFKF